MKQKSVLVVGYGSIGARHAEVLSVLGCRVAIVSQQKIEKYPSYSLITQAIDTESPDYIVIANATILHGRTLMDIRSAGYEGDVLVEKPLVSQLDSKAITTDLNSYVGYNLRFHPTLQRLKQLIGAETVLSVQAYVGQYLPDWRPGRDYRDSYSASSADGGGVLRDLSHELDLVLWLFGDWIRVAANGGHYSKLEIDSDDLQSVLLVTRDCPNLCIQMNYLDRNTRRFLIINTDEHTIHADLISGALKIDGIIENYSFEHNQTYKNMHESVLSKKPVGLCSFADGVAVMSLIHAIEDATEQQKWIRNSIQIHG